VYIYLDSYRARTLNNQVTRKGLPLYGGGIRFENKG
jgi:hypothetical protein